MTVGLLFQLSVIVFCVVSTVFILVLFIWFILLRKRINILCAQLDEIFKIAKDTEKDVQSFVGQTIKSLEIFEKSLVSFKFIGKIATNLIELIRDYQKGTKDGQEK